MHPVKKHSACCTFAGDKKYSSIYTFSIWSMSFLFYWERQSFPWPLVSHKIVKCSSILSVCTIRMSEIVHGLLPLICGYDINAKQPDIKVLSNFTDLIGTFEWMSLGSLELLFSVLRRLSGDQISVAAGATLSSYLYGSSELSAFKGNTGGFFCLTHSMLPLHSNNLYSTGTV